MPVSVVSIAELTVEQKSQLKQLWDDWDTEPPPPNVWSAGLSLVALRDGQVVGFIAATYGGQPFAYVDMAIIREGLRGRGLILPLLYEIERRLYALGVRHIRIVTEHDSTVPGIVTRLGWEPLMSQIVLEKQYV